MTSGIAEFWPQTECYNKFNTTTEIRRIDINRKEKIIDIEIYCSRVDRDYINYFEILIKNKLIDYQVGFLYRFSKDSFDEAAFFYITDLLKKSGKSINGVFDDAVISLGYNQIHIELKHGGESLIESLDFQSAFNRIERELFSTEHILLVTVDATAVEAERQKNERIYIQAEKDKAEKSSKKSGTSVIGKSEYLLLGNDRCEVLLGKNISISPIVPLSEISGEIGNFTVWGEVFSIDEFETRRGVKITTILITDFTGSITIKFISKNNEINNIPEIFKGDSVVVHGDIDHDRYSSDNVMSPREMIKVNVQTRIDDQPDKRVELHLHTNMSAMDAIPNAEQVVDFAYSLGHKAVAITDHGVLQAYPEASKTYAAIKKKNPDADFKLIYGVECYFIDDSSREKDKSKSIRDLRSNHMILLVRNKTGLKNLYKLISVSHTDYFYYRPRIPLSELLKYREGLLIGSACEQGEIFRAVMEKMPESEIDRIADKYDYFEIQPIANNKFMIRNGTAANDEELQILNRRIIELGSRLNKPVVATCDVHFLHERDSIYRKILLSAKNFEDSDSQAPLYFRTTKEMLDEFRYLDEATRKEVVIKAPNRIAEMIEADVKPIPDGTYNPYIEGAEQTLKESADKAIKDRYGDNPHEFIVDRMEKELGSILKNGFSTLYILASKLVERSKNDGYYVGSRGSVGSSFIAYLLGISDVNPLPAHYLCKSCGYFIFIKDAGSGYDLENRVCPECGVEMKGDGHNIPFETFLGFNGDKAPDIDLNFSSEYQSRAHKYTEELFGSGYVFKAGTISTLKEKTSFGFVKKYLEENNLVISKAEENRFIEGCAGVKRTTGQHPGGMVLVPKDFEITDFTPIQHPADSKDSGVTTTHFDFDSLKETLLKLDLLGHDVPTMYKRLEDLSGVQISDIPMNDKMVYELFTSIEPLGIEPDVIGTSIGTLGVPEMGTQFVEQILIESAPQNFSDLIQVSGLSHGTDVWRGNAQQLIKNGTCSISEVIGTRDSIMVYLMGMGIEPQTAFDITEFTRRGRAAVSFTDELQRLVKSHGVPEWYIESCKRIKYMFPKAHAAAYVMSAIHISWFKLYYPLEYYATYFTVRGGDIDIDAALGGKQTVKRALTELKRRMSEDAKKSVKDDEVFVTLQITAEMLFRGFSFLPVDIYKSEATEYKIEDKKLRLPFIALKGIGESAAGALKDAACKGRYLSAEDMLSEPGITQSLIDMLDDAGALGSLPKTSQISLF